MELKIRSLKFIGFCCFLCWILHLLINSCIPVILNGPLNTKNFNVKNDYGFCSWRMQEGFIGTIYTMIYFSPDIMSLGITVWASGSVIVVLHTYKQQVQHICSNRLSTIPSHEVRATRTIVILVSSLLHCIHSTLF